MRLIAIAAALIVSAHASSAARVALVVRLPDSSPASQPDVVGALSRAGTDRGDEILRAPFALARAALAAGAVRRARLRAFSRSREIAAEGLSAYQSADLDFASSRLTEARRVAIEAADLPGGLAHIAELSIALGAARHDLGDPRYSADFALAQRLAPERAVTTLEYKPAIVEAYEAVREGSERASRHPLLLQAAGADRIIIDGNTVDSAGELSVEAGLHVIVASSKMRATTAALIEVPHGGPVGLEISPDPSRQLIAEGRSILSIGKTKKQLRAGVMALVTYADADAVVIASAVWRRGQATLLAERCAGIPARCTRTVEVRYGDRGGLAAAARAVWRSLASEPLELAPGLLLDERVARAEGPPGSAPAPAPAPWYRSPLVWAGAAATALVVAGAILVFDDTNERPAVVVGSDVFPSP